MRTKMSGGLRAQIEGVKTDVARQPGHACAKEERIQDSASAEQASSAKRAHLPEFRLLVLTLLKRTYLVQKTRARPRRAQTTSE